MTAFVLHELAHKVTANYFGHYAAFSYSKQGLFLAAIVSFLFGFLFAAPGAVFIYGQPTRRENGMISLAGPMTNLVLGIFFSGLFFVFIVFSLFIEASSFLASAFFLVASINIFIGAFNMIPVMPFDGAKIWKWNKAIYVLMLVFFIPLMLSFFLLMI
jgi:Zn-dependent protease